MQEHEQDFKTHGHYDKVKGQIKIIPLGLHPYNPNQCPYQDIKLQQIIVSEILSGQDFIGEGHYSRVKGQLKVTPWLCTATASNQYPYQVSTSYTLQLPRYSPDKIF